MFKKKYIFRSHEFDIYETYWNWNNPTVRENEHTCVFSVKSTPHLQREEDEEAVEPSRAKPTPMEVMIFIPSSFSIEIRSFARLTKSFDKVGLS